jgi:hypothetical protein
MIALRDLLTARGRILEAEQRRERVLSVPFRRLGFHGRSRPAA